MQYILVVKVYMVDRIQSVMVVDIPMPVFALTTSIAKSGQ